EMVTDLAASLDPAEVLGHLLRRAAASVAAEWGTLLEVDPRRMVLEAAHDLHRGRDLEALVGIEGQPLLVEALRDRRLVVAAPFTEDMLPAVAQAWGVEAQSVAVLPLTAGRTVVAVLVLGRREAVGFSEDDVAM